MLRLLILVLFLGACGGPTISRNATPTPGGGNPAPSVFGLAYSPFRPGDDPNLGLYPSIAEVKADLDQLDGKVDTLLFYSSAINTGFNGFVRLAASNSYNFRIIATAYINDPNASWAPAVNRAEIDGLVDLINSGVPMEFGVVGVEAVLFNRLTPAQLIAQMDAVRAKIAGSGVPITTIDTWTIWRDNPALAANVDIIAVNIHPYWDGVSIDSAVDHTLARYKELQALYPNDRIVITETGWPSAGPQRGAAVPSLANAQKFHAELGPKAAAIGAEVIRFSFADEAWKTEGGVGSHWGILNENRTAKIPYADDIGK